MSGTHVVSAGTREAIGSLLGGRRIFITGARGFVGRHVVALGRAYRVEMHVLSRNGSVLEGVEVWPGDITDQARISEILGSVQPHGVIHLAAGGVEYGAGSLADLVRVNCVGLASLLQALDRVACGAAVVCAGSGFEYAPRNGPLSESDPIAPPSSYGVSKAVALPVARFFADRIPITLVRLFSLYGPGERAPRLAPYVIQQAAAGRPIDLTAGEQLRDYTYVADAAQALFTALAVLPSQRMLRVVNFASGRPITVRGFCEILGAALRARGLRPELRFGARPYRTDEPMQYTADITRWVELFGEPAITPLQRGVETMVAKSLKGEG